MKSLYLGNASASIGRKTRPSQAEFQAIPSIVPRKEPLGVLHPFRSYMVLVSARDKTITGSEIFVALDGNKSALLTRILASRLVSHPRCPSVCPLVMLPHSLLQLHQRLGGFEAKAWMAWRLWLFRPERNVDLLPFRRDIEPSSWAIVEYKPNSWRRYGGELDLPS